MKILEYRNDETIHRDSEASQQILSASHAENRIIVPLSEKMQRDSRWTRVVTCIAFIYLPASLVAVSPPTSVKPTISNADVHSQSIVRTLSQKRRHGMSQSQFSCHIW